MLAALMMGAAFSACSQTQQTEQTEQTQETQTEEKSEESAQATEQTKEGQWEFTDSLGRTVSLKGRSSGSLHPVIWRSSVCFPLQQTRW